MEGSDDDCKSINSTEHQTSESSSLNLSRTESASNVMNHHPIRIEYEPESMWFDYQALFDQTKIWVLHNDPIFKIKEFETIPVQHIDFEKNTLAKEVLFGDKVHNTLINPSAYSLFDVSKRPLLVNGILNISLILLRTFFLIINLGYSY